MVSAFDTAADILLGTRPRYTPRGGARAIYEADDPEVVVCGPAGSGKSRAVIERIHRLCSDHELVRVLIVRKTLASLSSSAIVTYEQHVAAQALADGDVTYFGGSTREPPQYRYAATGSRIMLGGLDTAAAVLKVMSTEYDIIFVQEAIEIRENDWEQLSTRLRNGRLPKLQLLADTNPSSPSHWLKQRADRGVTRMIPSTHEDNPMIFDDSGQLTERGKAYMARLDALTGVRLQRLRYGRWVAAEGVVYEGWDPAVHVVDRFDVPADWPRFWAIDFGYTAPFVAQWWAQDPDGRLWLYREWIHTKMLVEDHARKMLDLVTDDRGRWVEPRPRAIVCDHDSEGQATLRKHLGLSTVPAKKEVARGIEAVAVRLRDPGDGKPRLLVLRDSVVERDPDLEEGKKPIGLAEEIEGYIWAPSLEGKPVKEEPAKIDDHALDAARYVVAHLDLGGRPRIRHF